MKEVVQVEAYNLMEFIQKTQQKISEGYVFDFDSNENAPQTFGSYMACNMIKVYQDKQELVEEVLVKDTKTKSKVKVSKENTETE